MKKILLIIVLMVTFSCNENLSEQLAPYSSELIYFKDNKTDLCFSYIWIGDYHGGPAMTNVPCENVKNVLEKRPNFIKGSK